MKRLLLVFGTLGAGIVVFFVLLSGIGWEEILIPLREFSFGKGVVLILLTGLFLIMGAMRWQKVLAGQGEKMPLRDMAKIYTGGFFFLFFVPVIPFMSEVFRSSALKKVYGIDMKKGAASVVVDRILEVTSNVCVVVVGGIIFLFAESPLSYSGKAVGIMAFIVLWVLGLSFLYVRLFQNKSIFFLKWRNGHIQGVEEEVAAFFSVTNRFFWQSLWLSFARSVVGLFRVWALIAFLGKGIALLPGITILGFYYLAVLMPIPGALGSHDVLQAAGFEAFGLGAGVGAAFALLVRAAEGLFAVGGLLVVLALGFSLGSSFAARKEGSS